MNIEIKPVPNGDPPETPQGAFVSCSAIALSQGDGWATFPYDPETPGSLEDVTARAVAWANANNVPTIYVELAPAATSDDWRTPD